MVASAFCLLLEAAPAAALAVQGVCFGDIEKLCADIKPIRTAIFNCLKANENELSAPCENYMAKRLETRKRIKEYPLSCKDDVSKYCGNVGSTKGAVYQCLKEHANELSVACKEDIIANEERIQKAKECHQACNDDVRKLCIDKRSKRLGAVKCFQENEDQLSTPCQALMDKEKAAKEEKKPE